METSMRENLKTAKKMDMEFMFLKMVMCMKGNLKRTLFMEEEN